MYGDNYVPENAEAFLAMTTLFSNCESRDVLAQVMLIFLLDKAVPRPDIHVAHKRTCLLKGWET